MDKYFKVLSRLSITYSKIYISRVINVSNVLVGTTLEL